MSEPDHLARLREQRLDVIDDQAGRRADRVAQSPPRNASATPTATLLD